MYAYTSDKCWFWKKGIQCQWELKTEAYDLDWLVKDDISKDVFSEPRIGVNQWADG